MTTMDKTRWSVLVILGPVLFLMVVAIVTGSAFGIGVPELTILALIWIIGLVWVWWPRKT